jgi:hypothetical protein
VWCVACALRGMGCGMLEVRIAGDALPTMACGSRVLRHPLRIPCSPHARAQVFVDADGSTHWYKELEVNAINTSWHLTLPQPYINSEAQRAHASSATRRHSSLD